MVEKKAYEIMEKDVVAVSPNTSIISSITLIENSNIDLLPVIDNNKLVGIVDESTLREFAIKHGRSELDAPIKPLIKEPVFVEGDNDMKEVIVEVVKHNITRIPVVESKENMRCIGIISASDLLKSAGGRLGAPGAEAK